MRKSFDLELMSNEEMLYYPGLIQAFSRFKKEIKKKIIPHGKLASHSLQTNFIILFKLKIF